jgi:hypothetical protein
VGVVRVSVNNCSSEKAVVTQAAYVDGRVVHSLALVCVCVCVSVCVCVCVCV